MDKRAMIRSAAFRAGRMPLLRKLFITAWVLEQINFEMRYISKVAFCQKMRFLAEPTPRCGAPHSCAASEHLNFFKVKML